MEIDRRTFMKLPLATALTGELEKALNNRVDKVRQASKVTGRVIEADTSPTQDCTFIDLKINGKEVNFILPLRYNGLEKGDMLVFYDCKIKEGSGCWYITNRGGYSSLEIYKRGSRKSVFTLDGKEAYRRERIAYMEVLKLRNAGKRNN